MSKENTMSAVQKLLCAGVLSVIAAGCSGRASPEVDISCGASPNTTTFDTFLVIQKTVTASDVGSGTTVPANGITAKVISPTAAIQICEGDCADGNGSFKSEQDVTTDDDGIFLYTIGVVDQTVEFDGDLIEVFSATNACFTTIQLEGDGL